MTTTIPADKSETHNEDSGTGLCLASQLTLHPPTKEREPMAITLGPRDVVQLMRALPGFLPYGKDLVVQGREHTIEFKPSEYDAWVGTSDTCTIRLSPRSLQELSDTLAPEGGTYAISSWRGLSIKVLPS